MAKKILVIDDEELIIKSLSRLLEKNGYEVFIVKNGQDAFDMVEEEDFDLILADIRMPGMNGVEIIEKIKKEKSIKGQKQMPIIFITGYADEVIEKKARVLSPVGYLYKPFDNEKLLNAIKKILN